MEKEIDLKNLFNVIKRRVWILIAFALLFSAAGGLYSAYYTTPVYSASAKIMIRDESKFFNTLTEVMREPVIMKKVAEELKLNRSPEALASQIIVTPAGESQIVEVTVTDANPLIAAKIANSTMKHYMKEIPKLLNFNNMKIIRQATEKVEPYKESPVKKMMMGLIIGIVLSIGLIFLLDSLDDSIRSEAEAEKISGIPILGTVSKMNRKTAPHIKNKRLKLSVRGESVVSYK
ncbi:capsular biosynthesis protein [Metabacillus sp. KIGAM252]|uniref:Capsular biosynthesis protein n=1 Tax=Metabacillus flavus TaxID=2823519 RepID=A0ABS5LFY9_9BACI|nr:capsular biosynthesis protein [Metabacillus flavus]